MSVGISIGLTLRDADVQGLKELGVDVGTPEGVGTVRRIVLTSLLSRIRPELVTQSPEGEEWVQKAIHHLMPK